MTTQGQGHLLTFVQGHSYSTFLNFFPLKKHKAVWSQFSYGASTGCWDENDENLLKYSGSQDGFQTHIC